MRLRLAILRRRRGGREVAIRKPFSKIAQAAAAMQIEAVGLAVEFIPAEVEPVEPFVDGIQRRLRVPLDVGIVDAQDTAPPWWRAYSQLKMNVRALPI